MHGPQRDYASTLPRRHCAYHLESRVSTVPPSFLPSHYATTSPNLYFKMLTPELDVLKPIDPSIAHSEDDYEIFILTDARVFYSNGRPANLLVAYADTPLRVEGHLEKDGVGKYCMSIFVGKGTASHTPSIRTTQSAQVTAISKSSSDSLYSSQKALPTRRHRNPRRNALLLRPDPRGRDNHMGAGQGWMVRNVA